MVVGFADITGKGKLTSQLCFFSGLFTQFSDKQHILITRKPIKAEFYLQMNPEETSKKQKDIMRLAINGQLTTQLLKDYSIPLMKGLDYLDASFVNEKTGEYRKALYDYLLEKAGEGYHCVFADIGDEIGNYDSIDKTVLCCPQSSIMMRECKKSEDLPKEKEKIPLVVFGAYLPKTKWTKKQLTRGMTYDNLIGVEFSYQIFDAFNNATILDFLKRNYLKWEKEYKLFLRFISSGERGSK